METELPLRDIHLPPPIGWWPPAPGWWIVLFGVPTLGLLMYWFVKWLRRKTPKKLALDELDTLIQAETDNLEKVRRIAVLLRRTALSVYPREQVAGLTGEEWLAFLDASLPDKSFSQGPGRLLMEAPYRREATDHLDALFALCREWIKALPSTRKP